MTDAEKLHLLTTAAGPFLAELLASTGGDVHLAHRELDALRRGLETVRRADSHEHKETP